MNIHSCFSLRLTALKATAFLLAIGTVFAEEKSCRIEIGERNQEDIDIESCSKTIANDFSAGWENRMSGDIRYDGGYCIAKVINNYCGCFWYFQGPDSLFTIKDIATVNATDTLNLADTSLFQYKYSAPIDQYVPFVLKKDSLTAICWTEYDMVVPSNNNAILNCTYRVDGINQYDLNIINPLDSEWCDGTSKRRPLPAPNTTTLEKAANFDLLGRECVPKP